jgi:acetolactate decarboxylase
MKQIAIRPLSTIQDLEEQLSSHLKTKNYLHAFRIEGSFQEVKLRSVLKQKPPFRPFQNQPKAVSDYKLTKAKGTILGLRFPSFLSSLNVEGYHFHFLNEEKTVGGHLCSATILDATAQTCPIENMQLHLPDLEEFQKMDLA